MINLNDADFLEKLAGFVPYILTLLSFVIAIFNQRIVDLRKDKKIEEKSARFARYFFIFLGLVIAGIVTKKKFTVCETIPEAIKLEAAQFDP